MYRAGTATSRMNPRSSDERKVSRAPYLHHFILLNKGEAFEHVGELVLVGLPVEEAQESGWMHRHDDRQRTKKRTKEKGKTRLRWRGARTVLSESRGAKGGADLQELALSHHHLLGVLRERENSQGRPWYRYKTREPPVPLR